MRSVMTFQDFAACIPEGFKAMVSPMLILSLAWTLSGLSLIHILPDEVDQLCAKLENVTVEPYGGVEYHKGTLAGKQVVVCCAGIDVYKRQKLWNTHFFPKNLWKTTRFSPTAPQTEERCL